MNIVESHEQEFNKVIEFLKKDVQAIRTNRASVDLVAHILVETYGTKTPMEQLASINLAESRTIVIQPWDRNIVKDIEKALVSANLGAMPSSQEGMVRINLPPLNEESRNNLVKILEAKLENARQSLRSVRNGAREEIIKQERAKEITEDDKYRFLEDLDKSTGRKQEEIKLIGERKEKEITTI